VELQHLLVLEMRWKMVALALLLIAAMSAIAIGYELEKRENVVRGTGTIVWLNFEGGFWGIIGDDGGTMTQSIWIQSSDVRTYEYTLRQKYALI